MTGTTCSAGNCTCGCCAGATDRTPAATENRPGLAAIAYRVGTHGDFLASMIAGLTDAGRPALAALSTRDPDDFTIGLLDAWAVTSDVLTFYTERLAQESFLRTATERTSLAELGRLIGYQLRPGVAAETSLAFSAEHPPPAPPSATGEPGSSPPVVPEVVSLPLGLRVQSIPGPNQAPQTFETVEDLDARPEWNAITASTTTSGVGATDAWLSGAALSLRPGDPVLFVSGAAWDLRFLSAVVADPGSDRTHIFWSTALASVAAGSIPTPFLMRKRLSIFGHNAPPWGSMSALFRADYIAMTGDTTDTANQADWPDFDVDLTNPSAACIHVDGSHPDVVLGSKVVIRFADSMAIYDVGWVSEGSEAEFAVSGNVTHLILSGSTSLGTRSRRDLIAYAASEPVALARSNDTSVVTGDRVRVDADPGPMAPGRRLIVTGTTTAGEAAVVATTLDSVEQAAGGWNLVLTDALTVTLVRSSVRIHANVALATHGETVSELLGSGRAQDTHQRFTLANRPLTHVQSTDASGATPALEVRVNDVRWDLTPTLYGSPSSERSYVLRTDENDDTYVQFGDGTNGARLPTGSHNVRARYRKGLGSGGNVDRSRLANLLDRPLGLKGVTNPTAATGGVDPEAPEAARATIPLAVRTLGRAVSVLDYEDYARSFAGVSKASAVVVPLRSGNSIVVTVAFGEQGTDAVGDRLDDLGRSLRDHGDPHAEVIVLDHLQVPFRLALKVAVDPAYETAPVLAAVDTAVRTAFAFPRRDFGSTVEQSQVIAVGHTVPGVLALDLDALYDDDSGALSDRLVAPAVTVTPTGAATPAGILVADDSPFDWLEVMS